MKAIHFKEGGGGSETLEVRTNERPKPGPKDILVQVKAVSVNPVDTKIRLGKFPASDVTGFDAAGTVEEVGEDVVSFGQGDEVYYAGHLGRPGAMAQYHLIDSRLVAMKPKSIDFATAAAYPLVSLTAWELFVDHFGMIPLAAMPTMASKSNDHSILIINGAGGVGSIATQLARRVFKLKNVVVTASRTETIGHAKQMGATHVINHHKDLGPQLEQNGIGDVKYIMICYNTQQYLAQATEIAAPFGKIGSVVETDRPLDFQSQAAFAKSLSFHWEFMMTRPTAGLNMESHGRYLKQIAKLIDSGTLTSLIFSDVKTLSRDNLVSAHDTIESGRSIGKIVFTLGDGIE